MSRYMSPLTDFGFKTLFGQEANKDILIAFLNDIFAGERVVRSLQYLDKELTKKMKEARTIIYDIFCTGDDGEHFIVEMQNKVGTTFDDRAVYYVCSDIARQGESGRSWDYKLMPVYGIFILNSPLREHPAKLRTDVELRDCATNKRFSDKMRLIMLQLPFFDKTEEECETDFDKWIFLLKHMETLERLPFTSQRKIFAKLASVADVDRLREPARSQYEASLKAYRDTYSIIKTEREDGRKEGRLEGLEDGRKERQFEIARNLKALGQTTQIISQATGLSVEEIEKL